MSDNVSRHLSLQCCFQYICNTSYFIFSITNVDDCNIIHPCQCIWHVREYATIAIQSTWHVNLQLHTIVIPQTSNVVIRSKPKLSSIVISISTGMPKQLQLKITSIVISQRAMMEMAKCNTANISLNNWYHGPVSTRTRDVVVNDLLFLLQMICQKHCNCKHQYTQWICKWNIRHTVTTSAMYHKHTMLQ
jgi:hypothetical protein